MPDKMKLWMIQFANSRPGQALAAGRTQMDLRLHALMARAAASPEKVVLGGLGIWGITLGLAAFLGTAGLNQKCAALERTTRSQESRISQLGSEVSARDTRISGLETEKAALSQQNDMLRGEVQAKDQQIYALSNPRSQDDIPWISRLLEWVAGIVGGEMARMILKWVLDWLGSMGQH